MENRQLMVVLSTDLGEETTCYVNAFVGRGTVSDSIGWGRVTKPGCGATVFGRVVDVASGHEIVSFSGDVWRFLESQGHEDDFLKICFLSARRAQQLVALIEKSLSDAEPDAGFNPVFYRGLVTHDVTASAWIMSPTRDPDVILRAADDSCDFEIDEGNPVENYFGAGPSENIEEIAFVDVLEWFVRHAGHDSKGANASCLDMEVKQLRAALAAMVRIADGAVDHQSEIDQAKMLLRP